MESDVGETGDGWRTISHSLWQETTWLNAVILSGRKPLDWMQWYDLMPLGLYFRVTSPLVSTERTLTKYQSLYSSATFSFQKCIKQLPWTGSGRLPSNSSFGIFSEKLWLGWIAADCTRLKVIRNKSGDRVLLWKTPRLILKGGGGGGGGGGFPLFGGYMGC